MDLTGLQRDVLVHLLLEGDDVPANMAEATGSHRNSIVRACRPLLEEGLVENKGHGVYTLTPGGRETAREIASDRGVS